MEKNNTKKPEQIVLKELDKSNDRVDFSKLSNGDKFQVLTRYLNDLCSMEKSMLQIVADQYILIEFMCKKMGIDVKAEKEELTKKIQEQFEQTERAAKQALAQAKVNKA